MNVRMLLLLDTLPPDRFFDMDMQTVIQTAANAFILILLGIILTRILYAPVRDFLKERTARIQRQLDEAKDNKATAMELRSRYDHQLKDIDLERTAILDEARKHANQQRELLINQAKDEVRDLKYQAGVEIEAERMRVRDEIYSAIVDISSDMAEKLLLASIDKQAHERLFDESLAELDRALYMPSSL